MKRWVLIMMFQGCITDVKACKTEKEALEQFSEFTDGLTPEKLAEETRQNPLHDYDETSIWEIEVLE